MTALSGISACLFNGCYDTLLLCISGSFLLLMMDIFVVFVDSPLCSMYIRSTVCWVCMHFSLEMIRLLCAWH